MAECDLRLNGVCKGEAHYGETCSRLRPLVCEVRRRIEAAKAWRRRLIEEQPDYPEQRGCGS